MFLIKNHPEVQYDKDKHVGLYKEIKIKPVCVNSTTWAVTVPRDFASQYDYLYFCGNIDDVENKEFYFVRTEILASQKMFTSKTAGNDPYIDRKVKLDKLTFAEKIKSLSDLEADYFQPRRVSTSIF